MRPDSHTELWHYRAGHASMARIKYMSEQEQYVERRFTIPAKEWSEEREKHLCKACGLGKATRHFKHTKVKRAQKKGELWHADFSGPFAPSIEGNQYMVVIVDSATRMTFVYFTKRRDDTTVIEMLQLFYDEVIRPIIAEDSSLLPIFMQTDNGEFESKKVNQFCTERGIIQRFTQPGHSSSNGLAEVQIRYIKESARSMMLHADLPQPYWQCAASHAVFVRNRMPNTYENKPVMDSLTLYTNKTCDYSLWRIWGSRAFVVPLTHSNDQVQRSNEGILVGLKGNQYKVYDPRMNKFLYSGNVTFDENVGNFAMQKLHASMQIPPNKAEYSLEHFTHLIGTVHLDPDELAYEVVNVRIQKGLIVVDRVPVISKIGKKRLPIDTIHALDALQYRVLGDDEARIAVGDDRSFTSQLSNKS